VDIEQQSPTSSSSKLEITGTADELRKLALRLLDAIDTGKAKAKVHGTKLTLRCRE
jgi:hypothetical protein